jgi:hypothetical protein
VVDSKLDKEAEEIMAVEEAVETMVKIEEDNMDNTNKEMDKLVNSVKVPSNNREKEKKLI